MIFVKPLTAPHGKESAINAGDLGSIPGLGRSRGEGNGNPLLYSCLGNPMDRGAWQATVHRVTKVGHYLATKPPPPTVPHRGKHLASLFHFLLVTQLFFNWRILLY